MRLTVDIHKAYKGFRLDVAFEHSGGVLGLLGASGAGKSMTLQCIAGIVRPDRGHISLDGRVLYDSAQHIDLRPRERRVGYLFQNYALFPHMTVEENIGVALGLNRRQSRRDPRIRELLAMLKLEGLAARFPAQISGGQQQRVALARILAYQPQLILLDEPFSALDTYLKEQLHLQLQELLRDWGGEALMVTHNRNEAYTLCRRLLVLEGGQVLGGGDTAQLFDWPQNSGIARLTGCKNISRARKLDQHTLEALDWGIKLRAARPVPDALTACGVRAHYLLPAAAGEENALTVQLMDVVDNPFERNIILSCGGSEPLWWITTRDTDPAQLPAHLAIPPDKLLLFVD